MSHGRDIPIYRRVNWEKTDAFTTSQEIDDLYKWAVSEISNEAKKALDWLLIDYDQIVNRLENK